MQVIAVTNIKGGVGKTTTTVNLAYLASAGGLRTLVWDLDPQGAATYVLGSEPGERASAKKLVSGKRELSELVTTTAYERLGLVAADLSYRNFDIHMSERRHPTERLMRMLMKADLQESFDALFLDCPPGISLLSENVLRAADAVVVPMIPAPLSLRMLQQLVAFIADNGWSDLALLPFFSMVDRRRALHEQVIGEARAVLPQILRTEVPYWSDIERMTERRAPLPAYAPASAAAHVYSDLWREVRRHLREQ